MLTYDFKNVFYHSPLPIFIVQNGYYQLVNPKMVLFTGYTETELLQMPFLELIHPEDRSRVMSMASRRLAGEDVPKDYEFRGVDRSGEVVYIKGFFSFIEYCGQPAILGQLLNVTEHKHSEEALASDICKRKKIEELLQKERSYLSNILENLPCGVVLIDREQNIIHLNAAFSKLLGYSLEDIPTLEEGFIKFYPDLRYRKKAQKTWVDDFGRNCNSRTFTVNCKDGACKDIEFRPTFLEDGRMIVAMFDATERIRAEESLKASEAKWRAIFDSANDAIYVHDAKTGAILDANRKMTELFGYSLEEAKKFGMGSMGSEEPFSVENALKYIREATRGKPQLFEWLAKHKGGDLFWTEINLNHAMIEGRDCVLAMVRDITKRKQAEEALRETNQKLQAIIEASPLAIIYLDTGGKIKLWNHAAERIFGWKEHEVTNQLLPIVSNSQMEAYLTRFNRTLLGEGLIGEEYTGVRKDGSKIAISISTAPLADNQGNVNGIITVVNDITERKRIEEQLKYLATHDSLTGIPNRYSFEGALKRTIPKAKRGIMSTLLFIDIDNFKLVNDTKGHSAGDEVLIRIVNILKNNLRESDLMARLGGDEIAVLLEHTSTADALIVAEKLRRAVDESDLFLSSHRFSFHLSISIGVVLIDGTLNTQKLLSLADTALYAAKEKGRNRVSVTQPDKNDIEKLTEMNELILLVKKALKENRFTLLFQPVVQIASGEIIHYEALVRLIGEDGALISPHAFIPVAERFGLMSQVDRWVVGSALDTLRSFPDIRIFVNLSGVSMGDDALLEHIEDSIHRTGIEPDRIGFEITETAVVKDLIKANHWIHRLKHLGCQFALDDFGIGFSSFSYLHMLPVDFLKIDGSFVSNLDKNPTHLALVQSINEVANTLGKKTIAEFVENKEILKKLHDLQIEYGQGYYLGMPSAL